MGNPNKIFITGIDTDVGKTYVSAICAQALAADYWKPIQCGPPSDTEQIKSWLPHIKTWPNAYNFQEPISPHLAAAHENCQITTYPPLPSSPKLIVEGAGGVLCPLSQDLRIIDIAARYGLSVILVVKPYLGSYNHTLLSIEALRSRGLSLFGLIYNCSSNSEESDFISKHSHLPVLLHIPKEIDQGKQIHTHAQKLNEKLAAL